jgi:hypothetical protein
MNSRQTNTAKRTSKQNAKMDSANKAISAEKRKVKKSEKVASQILTSEVTAKQPVFVKKSVNNRGPAVKKVKLSKYLKLAQLQYIVLFFSFLICGVCSIRFDRATTDWRC